MGEQLFYALTEGGGGWLGVLVFCAASRRLRARDRWIGWSEEQRRRRLPLIVNHCRFLLLPHKTFPNLGSRALRLTLDRLSADWQKRYGHPVVLVETFVDPDQFSGTVTPPTAGRIWAPPTALAACAVTFMCSTKKPNASLPGNFVARPGAASRRISSSPRWLGSKREPGRVAPKAPRKSVRWWNTSRPCPTTVCASASIRCGVWPPWACWPICATRRADTKEWSLFAKGLSQVQRRALGVRRQADGYPAPGPSTFWRLMARIDADALEKIFLQVQEQLRSPAPPDELIVLEGKQPRHGGGHSVLTAVTVPTQYYLGSALVDQKTNEIPVARELFRKLELDGRKVSLDALHTQDQTAREMVPEHGADYLLTVKDNQPTLRAHIEKLIPAPPADFSPSFGHGHAGGPP